MEQQRLAQANEARQEAQKARLKALGAGVGALAGGVTNVLGGENFFTGVAGSQNEEGVGLNLSESNEFATKSDELTAEMRGRLMRDAGLTGGSSKPQINII
jgi:flagellar motor protein MotB